MLNDTGIRMMELSGKGYCCSQIMVLLALDELGRENPDLVRSASGLCNGLGDCSNTCGVFSGAGLLLGLYAGKGTDMEEPEDVLPLMLEALSEWFREATSPYGGTTCADILGGDCGQPDMSRCGSLLGAAYERVREIVVENGCDPSVGRGEA